MTNFDIDKNFWEVNSFFKVFFKDVYDEDKSKNKETSSLKMWCIAFYADDSKDNKYRNMSNDEKKRIIPESFLKYKGVDVKNTKKIKEIIDFDLDMPYVERYINIVLIKAKKLLRKWEDKLEERQLFINNQVYNKDTYDMLDDMMTKTAKMWQEYTRIKKETEEENETQGLGGMEESFLEKNM